MASGNYQRGCHNFDGTFLHLGLEFVCEDMSFVLSLFYVLFLCLPPANMALQCSV